ncbi:MAG: ATP phosphoribosyltransferase [Anaerolineaceae bacterium]|nr:ATP phosphoribosyltransferase [Anaerolineaceae bacterium]
MTKSLTLALPSKGAIAEPTINFLRDCGLRVEKPNQRQYTGLIPAIPSLSVLFQRVTDVLYKVADGTAQIGITGLDVVKENADTNVVVVHDMLGFGHCSLVVAVPEMWVDVEHMPDLLDVALDFRELKQRNIRIATKYPVLARQFLHEHGIHHFTLVKAEGAIEAAPTLGYADLIIDLTQTGTTLRENHLKILPDGIIIDSQACLIANRQALQQNPEYLHTLRILIEYIDATQHGRGYFQLVANVKGKSAEDVAEKVGANPITRGLQGPTISQIYPISNQLGGNEHWFTVTIIVANAHLLPAMEHIRSIGGSETIVSPVRYIFLEQSPIFQQLLKRL